MHNSHGDSCSCQQMLTTTSTTELISILSLSLLRDLSKNKLSYSFSVLLFTVWIDICEIVVEKKGCCIFTRGRCQFFQLGQRHFCKATDDKPIRLTKRLQQLLKCQLDASTEFLFLGYSKAQPNTF